MRRTIFVVVALALLGSSGIVGARAMGDRRSDQQLAAPNAQTGDAPDRVLDALAAGRLERSPAPPGPGEVEAPPVAVGYALTGADLGPYDVTGSEAAHQEVAALVARLAGRGIDVSGVDYRVYSLPEIAGVANPGPDADGPLASALVVPTGTPVELVGAVLDDTGLHVKTRLRASATPPAGTFGAAAAPGDSLGWSPAGGLGCVERLQNNTAWYDPCQYFFLLENDRDPVHDTYGSQMWGTGISKGMWTLNTLEVQSAPAGEGAAQQWAGWAPGSDTTGPCQKLSISVSVDGVGLGFDKQRCETWDIAKGEAAADFANRWRGHVRRHERETGAVVATRVAQGGVRVDLVDFDYSANP